MAQTMYLQEHGFLCAQSQIVMSLNICAFVDRSCWLTLV